MTPVNIVSYYIDIFSTEMLISPKKLIWTANKEGTCIPLQTA